MVEDHKNILKIYFTIFVLSPNWFSSVFSSDRKSELAGD